jgi:hypothetical protein
MCSGWTTLEQHTDKQISWVSEDGKKTRGTVERGA